MATLFTVTSVADFFTETGNKEALFILSSRVHC